MAEDLGYTQPVINVIQRTVSSECQFRPLRASLGIIAVVIGNFILTWGMCLNDCFCNQRRKMISWSVFLSLQDAAVAWGAIFGRALGEIPALVKMSISSSVFTLEGSLVPSWLVTVKVHPGA